MSGGPHDPVARFPADWLAGASGGRVAELARHHALVVEQALSPAECERWIAGVYRARQDWVADFGDQQFTLGLAFYTHLEQGRTAEYFGGAREARARVEAFAPGLAERIGCLAAALVGASVTQRPSFAGPGVQIFPPGAEVSGKGGCVHYDLEGLTPDQLARQAPAVSLMAVLQPAESGGGLRLWDDHRCHQPEERPAEVVGPPRVVLGYGAGDLVVIDSYRLHQIEPFTGGRDRIVCTAHLARALSGWELWF